MIYITLMYSYYHKVNIIKIGSTKCSHTTHIGKIKRDMCINDKLIGSTIMSLASLVFRSYILVNMYSLQAPPANEGSHL